MSTRLIIARHGNTFGKDDVVRRVGTTDLPLVESGLLQGQRLGIALCEQHWQPDVIFTSRLQRTQQTAQQAMRAMQIDVPVQPLAIFDEIDYGPDENQPEAEVLARIGEAALRDWETHAIVPAGWRVDPEQIIQDWHQFATTLSQDYAGQTILVVTSNGIARFAPYLTGDFASFAAQHAIKLATGAYAVFMHQPRASMWDCLLWNIKPR